MNFKNHELEINVYEKCFSPYFASTVSGDKNKLDINSQRVTLLLLSY